MAFLSHSKGSQEYPSISIHLHLNHFYNRHILFFQICSHNLTNLIRAIQVFTFSFCHHKQHYCEYTCVLCTLVILSTPRMYTFSEGFSLDRQYQFRLQSKPYVSSHFHTSCQHDFLISAILMKEVSYLTCNFFLSLITTEITFRVHFLYEHPSHMLCQYC